MKSSNFGPIRPGTPQLAAFERLKKSHRLIVIMGEMSLALYRLHINRILILAGNKDNHKSLNEFEFGGIPQLTAEVAALERLRNQRISLLAL